MNILALDLGTRTGWANNLFTRIESGVQVFDVKRGESPGMRYHRFNRWLEDVLSMDAEWPHGRCDLIVYEQTHHRGGAATEVAAGFATRVQEFCARHGIDHAAIHSATLKKWTTGNGRGGKDAMLTAVAARGWTKHMAHDDAVDDNEIDALALLHYALAELAPLPRGGDG